LPILFDAGNSSDPDGDELIQYLWQFDDGAQAIGAKVEKAYAGAGLFTITLTVTDARGASYSAQTICRVVPNNEPPVADAGGPYTGPVNQPIALDGGNSSDPDNDPLTYIKWSAATSDRSSSVTGSSVFDFDGDGSAEVVYADEYFLCIYRGTDDQVLFETPVGSRTRLELPVIADVDNDNNAEIVVAANNDLFHGPYHGILVFCDANDTWVNTRKIWNQHAYNVTNVNDDGTIPQYAAKTTGRPLTTSARTRSQSPSAVSI
jgi:PKD repeat protein